MPYAQHGDGECGRNKITYCCVCDVIPGREFGARFGQLGMSQNAVLGRFLILLTIQKNELLSLRAAQPYVRATGSAPAISSSLYLFFLENSPPLLISRTPYIANRGT